MRWPAVLLLLAICALGPMGCERLAPPPLVRDGAGMFSADAQAAAEARLRQAAADTGIWVFVVTDPDAEPPQMLRGPMESADDASVRALAILLNLHGVIAVGYSQESVELQDSMTFSPPDVSGLLDDGLGDEALAAMVDYAVTWSSAPPTVGPVPDVELEGPTPPGP